MSIDENTLVESFVPINMPVRDAVHMDMHYLDGVVDGQGILFEHFRAMPCPVGKEDPYDSRITHADHSGCSNGQIYEYAGDVACIFSGNSKQYMALDVGLVTGSTVQITIARYYDNSPEKEVVPAQFDRLYLKDDKARVIATQLFEHNVSGMDRVKYPILEVEHLIDSHGKRYYEGQDFQVVSGQISWVGTRQPGMNPATGKGEVCSIRYRYRPYWYIDRLLHEIRIVRDGLNSAVAPTAALIQREYVFENERNDPQAPESPRQGTAPRIGSFGPR